MRTSIAVLALSAISAVSAQRKIYTNADINAGAIDIQKRASWCQAESNTCATLCDRATVNTCETSTLEYNCTCSNGTAPGLEYYKQTMPTFICTQAFEDCIAANTQSARGQENCTLSIESQCGKADAADLSSASSSATAKPTSTPTGGSSNTGSETTATPAATSTPNAAADSLPARYGNVAAVAAIGLFAYLI